MQHFTCAYLIYSFLCDIMRIQLFVKGGGKMISKEYEKQLVEAVLDYLNEINKPNEEDRDKREIKGKHAYIDGVNAEKIVKKFVKEMSEIDAFNFFPFEAIDPRIAAIFCGNHLLQRGSVFNNLSDKSENEDKSSSAKKSGNGFREIMNNLKNEKYYNLRKDGLIDTFIIKKEELGQHRTKQLHSNEKNGIIKA